MAFSRKWYMKNGGLGLGQDSKYVRESMKIPGEGRYNRTTQVMKPKERSMTDYATTVDRIPMALPQHGA